MNPQDQYGTNEPNIKNPLATMQPGERNICEIKRHPFGMISMYISTGIMLVVLAVLAFVVAPKLITGTDKSQVLAIGTLVFVVISILTLGFVFVSHIIYWGNRWILTTDSLTQVSQLSLFRKHSSQLSLGNLEDVSAEQDGMLAQLLHFGTLRVETAGERSKFMLTFCLNPASYAQQILAAREAFEQGRRVAPFGNQDLNHFATRTQPIPTSNNTPPPPGGYSVPLDASDDNTPNDPTQS